MFICIHNQIKLKDKKVFLIDDICVNKILKVPQKFPTSFFIEVLLSILISRTDWSLYHICAKKFLPDQISNLFH